MSKIISLSSLTEFHKVMGYPKPYHPLISLVDLSKAELNTSGEQKFTTSLYSITLKTKHMLTSVQYGRKHLDFAEGVLLGFAPGQVYGIGEGIKKGDLAGWALQFHPDLLQGYALQEKISSFGFFSYEVFEALHLSDKEKGTLNSIIAKIEEETRLNIDDYSNDLLVANLELLMNYIRRHYGRQFKTRTSINSDLLNDFEKLLKQYVNSDKLREEGLPLVSYFADALHLSPGYFSDLIKKETGKTAQDHLHNELIRKAKTLLLGSQASVSQIAYELGFEHAPYFSRLFKNKTGLTPSGFRQSIN